MPSIGNKPIKDITFLDSLTGYAVANQYPTDSNYVLKTTNGGDNWQIIHRQYFPMQHIQFLNLNIGYSCAGYLYKTIDGGYNWIQQNTSGISAGNMHVLNQDTIWLTDADGFVGGIFRTTNGGINWQTQANFGSGNPDKIYMHNGRFGFANRNGGFSLYRTTNSGLNWDIVAGVDGFNDIYFVDTLTGWKAYGNMKKSTNGGLNWVTQTLPSGGIIQTSGMLNFSNVNKDTIWGDGGYLLFPNNQVRDYLIRTTNGGTNWLFQIPDTSIFMSYYYVNFVNRLNGWATSNSPTGIHTTTGGDTIFYTGIQQIPNSVPEKFILKQNYPNPFNPRTVIPYSVSSSAHVKIIAYDITGREVQRMVDSYHQAGAYEVDFIGKFTSTGVYLYRMTVTDAQSNQVYTDTKKMILLK
jgi:photosystem II stability/assembly factor-like uncharacterized protein